MFSSFNVLDWMRFMSMKRKPILLERRRARRTFHHAKMCRVECRFRKKICRRKTSNFISCVIKLCYLQKRKFISQLFAFVVWSKCYDGESFSYFNQFSSICVLWHLETRKKVKKFQQLRVLQRQNKNKNIWITLIGPSRDCCVA